MSPTPLNNDIGLIELSTPAIYNRHVQPICLPKPGQTNVPVGSECYITGQFNRNADEKTQYSFAKRAFHHPDWMSPTPLNNDIGLIELSTPAIYNRHVQPICLPKPGQTNVPVGSECYIT